MSEPIRILHVIGIMNRGGAETMIMNFYRNIDRTKVQFDFVEHGNGEADYDGEIRDLGGRIFRCPRYNGKNHFAYVAWWKRFLAEQVGAFHAVHGHIGSTASIYLHLAKNAGIYTIAHSHNTANKSLKNRVYQCYAYPTRYIADFFFGCSLDAGISRYGSNVCSDKRIFTVLNNAIETKKFDYSHQVRQEMRSRLGIENKLVIGHVGRFETQKNHEFLIRIFAGIRKIRPDAVLLLVGDGTLRPQIEAQIQQECLSDCVILAGVQSDISPWYQAMDVFVLPSLFEGKPFVLIEAQTSGIPCVISDGIPTEGIVTKDLVSIMRLTDHTDTWAAHILSRVAEPRRGRKEEVARNGYDILENARWLEHFYRNIPQKQGENHA